VRHRTESYLPGIEVDVIVGVCETGVFEQVLEIGVTGTAPALADNIGKNRFSKAQILTTYPPTNAPVVGSIPCAARPKDHFGKQLGPRQ
jgi:hypothetical protein